LISFEIAGRPPKNPFIFDMARSLGRDRRTETDGVAMNKAASALSIVGLAAIAVGSLFVINDPAHAQRLVGADAEDSRVVAQAAPAAKGGFDRKASATEAEAEGGKPDAAAPKRPPTREELEKQAAAATVTGIAISRKARTVGPVTEAGTTEPPLPQLYPFTINKTTFPDSRTVNLEIAIKNQSGVHWETAYVTLRSPRVKEGVLFQVNEWQIDEIVGLDYAFPRAELEDRVKELRVVSVSGKERQSALSQRLSATRREAVESVSPKGRRRGTPGEVLNAPGLLAYVGAFQSPFTGIAVKRTESRAPRTRLVKIVIPEESLLPITLGINLKQTSEERQQVSELAVQFHEAGLAVQESLSRIASTANGKTWQDATAAGLPGDAGKAREQLGGFNQLGVKLSAAVQRSADTEVRRLSTTVIDHSKKILGQIDAVEAGIRPMDPGFSLQK